MSNRSILVALLLACTASALPVIAQDKPQKPKAIPTWMDLPVGTDVTYAVDDDNKISGGGGGMGSGGGGKHEVRIVVLGTEAGGALRIAIFDETLPKESFETAIVHAEIVTLDPATGAMQRGPEAAQTAGMPWFQITAFPYPALSVAEWKAKKPVTRSMWTPVAGEPIELPMVVSFGTKKDGKKQVPTLTADLASKQPVAAKLVGIAGMVSMAQGQMPKLGASGIEPVPVEVVELHREYTFDPAKGRITAVRTTGKVTAADGKITVACNATQQETERRAVAAKDLPAVVEVVEELCAIASSSEPKEARKTRAEALQEKAAKAGFAATAKRLLDSLTRDGLPPGFPR
jgi:hypothetical protein